MLCWNSSCEKMIDLNCLSCLFCHRVMSVRLQIKLCSRDGWFAYNVRNGPTNLIVRIYFTEYPVPFGYVSKSGIIPYSFSTCWICFNIGSMSLSVLLCWPDWSFNPRSDNIVKGGQNRLLNSIPDRNKSFTFSLSIFWVKHFYKGWTFIVFSMVVGIPSKLTTVTSRSTEPLLTVTFSLRYLQRHQ